MRKKGIRVSEHEAKKNKKAGNATHRKPGSFSLARRIPDASAEQMPSGDVNNTAEWEAWVVQRADYFTCVWKKGPGEVAGRDAEYPSLKDTIIFRNHDPRKMIYAVMRVGRSVMIGPSQYEGFLKLRGEGPAFTSPATHIKSLAEIDAMKRVRKGKKQ